MSILTNNLLTGFNSTMKVTVRGRHGRMLQYAYVPKMSCICSAILTQYWHVIDIQTSTST